VGDRERFDNRQSSDSRPALIAGVIPTEKLTSGTTDFQGIRS